ncbi:MAG: two-component regulator propeller domain-containing protein, partial [Pseudomonadota bacterium]
AMLFFAVIQGSSGLAARSDGHELDLQFDHPLDTEGMIFNGGFIQDRNGFLWIGTQSGLLRYDGYDVKKYASGHDSISSDYCYTIFEDRDGLIWITTPDGLNKYDKESDVFTVYKNDPENPYSISHDVFNWTPQAVCEDADGYLWIGTQQGLNRYDKKNNSFSRYLSDTNNPHSLSSNSIWSVYVDKRNTLWIGTDKGIERFDKTANIFHHYQHDPKNPASISSNHITAIIEDKKSAIWIGTKKDGLNKFNQATGSFVRYKNEEGHPYSLSNNAIFSIAELKSGKTLITHGVDGDGFDVFDPETKTFTNQRPIADSKSSLSFNHIMNTYEDRADIVWIVTFNGKLDKIDKESKKFRLYQHYPNNDQSLSNNTIAVIYEDQAGIIWFGSVSGLDRYDPKTNIYKHYKHNPSGASGLAEDLVIGIHEDREGSLWLMGSNLCRFVKESGKCAEVFPIDCHVGSTIIEDKKNPDNLWIATNLGGLVKFNKTTKTATNFRHDPNDQNSISNDVIWHIIQDKHGIIWAPTYGGGLDAFDPKTEKVITHYRHDPNNPASIGSNTLNHVYEDSAGDIWVGTVGGGLNRLNSDQTFTRFITTSGFPTDNIQNIIEDNNGYLWLGTKIGLVRFDPKTEAIRLFTKSDGLQSNEFWEYPPLKASDGRLWIFGPNGANSFYPDKLKDNPNIPPVVVTSLTQRGEKLNLGKAPELVKEINLDWKHNLLEFEFTALNYTSTEKNQYKYKLEGLDGEWFNSGARRFGRYTNIPSGKYTLRILGSNNDGIWNEKGTSITITVVPPIWERWWFITIMGMTVIGVMLGGFHLRVRAIESHKQELKVQVSERTKELSDANTQLAIAKEKAEVANHAKSEFLANMSHELRTPLNAVTGFSELLSSVVIDPKQKSYLDAIKIASKGLLTLLNDILDLSKVEAGQMTINYAETNLKMIFLEIEQIFSPKVTEKGLRFIVDIDKDLPPILMLDEIRLRQILLNLAGNAVKFTEKGYIRLAADKNQGYGDVSRIDLIISVEDTGIGIPEDQREIIFESFKQQEGQDVSKFGGTGLGLAICKKLVEIMDGHISVSSGVGEGSTFEVILRGVAVPSGEASLIEEKSYDLKSIKPEVKKDEGSLNAFVNESIERPFDLIYILNDNVLPIFQSLKDSMIIGKVMELGKMLHQAGVEHNSRELVVFSGELNAFAEAFDIVNLEKKLQEFPALVERIMVTIQVDRPKTEVFDIKKS